MKFMNDSFIKIILSIVGLLGIIDIAKGQQSNTIYQTIRTNTNSADNSNYVSIKSIGQDLHQVGFRFLNAPGHICATGGGGNAGVDIKVSWDNVSFLRPTQTNIGRPYSFSTSDITQAYNVSFKGSWPYIKIATLTTDDINCRISAWYSGNISGNISDPQIFNSLQDTTIFKNLNGNATIGDNVLVVVSANTCLYSIYSLQISNGTAGQNLSFQFSDGTHWMDYYNLAAGQVITLPVTGYSYLNFTADTGLKFVATAATPVGVQMKYQCAQN